MSKRKVKAVPAPALVPPVFEVPTKQVQATLPTCTSLTAEQVCFHHYSGQATALRKWAKSMFSLDLVADLTDRELETHVLQQGWVPVVISGDSREHAETLYLLRKELLALAEPLYR